MALYRAVIIGFLLIGIVNITWNVLEENQMAHSYSVGTINIPIFGTMFLILFVSPLLCSIICFPKIAKKIYSFKNKLFARILKIIAVHISYSPCLYLSFYGSFYWTRPHHMVIACWFYITSLYLIFLFNKDLFVKGYDSRVNTDNHKITVPNLCQSGRYFLAFSDRTRNERHRKYK
jgi:hypothetical protein